MFETKGKTYRKDLREFKRVIARDEFLIEFIKENGTSLQKGFGCDLSATGVRFNTLVPFKKGRWIRMKIHLSPKFPGPRLLELFGKVVRRHLIPGTHYYQVSCQFESRAKDMKTLIQQFIHWMIRQPWSESYGLDLEAKPSHGKRAVSRIIARDEFILEFYRQGKPRFLEHGHGCDLSVLGASFMTPAKFSPHERIHILLQFSPEFQGTKSVQTPAEVRRVVRQSGKYYYEVGCRFLDKKGTAKEAVQEFLNWLKVRASGSK